MTSGDAVGWLVWGFSEKGALCHGLFYCGPLAIVTFSKVGIVLCLWVWGGQSLLILDCYCYIGIEFSNAES